MAKKSDVLAHIRSLRLATREKGYRGSDKAAITYECVGEWVDLTIDGIEP